MEDEAHLTVIARLIEVGRLQAEKEHCNRSHVRTSGQESEELATEVATKAKEAKEAQDKVLQDAVVILGVSVPSRYEKFTNTNVAMEDSFEGKDSISSIY